MNRSLEATRWASVGFGRDLRGLIGPPLVVFFSDEMPVSPADGLPSVPGRRVDAVDGAGRTLDELIAAHWPAALDQHRDRKGGSQREDGKGD